VRNIAGDIDLIQGRRSNTQETLRQKDRWIITLESRRKSHRRSKTLRYRVKTSTLPTHYSI